MDDDGEEAKRRNRIMIERLREVEQEVGKGRGGGIRVNRASVTVPSLALALTRRLRRSSQRIKDLKAKLEAFRERGEMGAAKAMYLDKLLELRPNVIVGEDKDDPVIRISCDIGRKLQFQGEDSGFPLLTRRMIEVTSMKKKSRNGRNEEPLFLSLGSNSPQVYTDIKKLIFKLQSECPFIEYKQFVVECEKKGINPSYISDALHYFSGIGIILYFGSDSALRKTTSRPELEEHKGEDDDYDDESYGTDTESMSTNSTVYTKSNAAPGAASTTVSTPSKLDRSVSSVGAAEDITQFVFLNPIWLMMACKSILRHELQTKLRHLAKQQEKLRKRNQGFYARTDCPVISRTEVREGVCREATS